MKILECSRNSIVLFLFFAFSVAPLGFVNAQWISAENIEERSNDLDCGDGGDCFKKTQKSEQCNWVNDCPISGNRDPACCHKQNGNDIQIGTTCHPWWHCSTTVTYCTESSITNIIRVQKDNGCDDGFGVGTKIFTATCNKGGKFVDTWLVECEGPCNGSPC